MATSIGNYGFEYTVRSDNRKRQRGLYCTVKNIKTGKTIFTLKGTGTFWARRGAPSSGSSPSKKFLGFDDRWYYIQISGGTTVNWGQIQSSGAVLKSDRTMLTHIDFYPMYTPKAPAPVIKTISQKPPVVTISPAFKKISPTPKTISPTPETITKEESLWYKNLITQINQIIDQIEKMIRSILKI